MLSLEFSGWHADQKFKGCCKEVSQIFRTFIYMVTETHAQLQGGEITEDLFVCDSI